MKRILLFFAVLFACASASAQQDTTFLTLDDAIRIALSENATVKVADKEVERVGYAKKGTYASLFPSIDMTGSYQRTLKKQVMYMTTEQGSQKIEVGRNNTFSAGVSAAMPIVNAALWQSLKLSGQEVELAVEKARGSRLDMVSQVKNAYYMVLLAEEVFNVYKEVYENAYKSYQNTERKYNAQRASELDLIRSKASLMNSIPDVISSEHDVSLALWQLKAVIGMNLDSNIGVKGTLKEHAGEMYTLIKNMSDLSLENNSSLKQLAIQAEELATNIKLQKAANAPSLALAFNFAYNGMDNTFNFKQYNWTPYSYAGLSLQIPIFAGGKRRNAIKQAQVQSESLEIQRVNAERQLKIAIQQYLKQIESVLKSYEAAETGVELAHKAYGIAEKTYDVGRGTLTDLYAAQLTLSQARLGMSQTIYTYLVAKAGLEQILGVDYNNE